MFCISNRKHILFLFIILLHINEVLTKSRGGVYRYVNKHTHRTHYVGATNDFSRRHNEHKSDKRYFTGDNYEMKRKHMSGNPERKFSEEIRQIHKYNPVANKHSGGNGRRPK